MTEVWQQRAFGPALVGLVLAGCAGSDSTMLTPEQPEAPMRVRPPRRPRPPSESPYPYRFEVPDDEALRQRDETALRELQRIDEQIRMLYTDAEQLRILSRVGLLPDETDRVWGPDFGQALSVEARAAVDSLWASQGTEAARIRFVGDTIVLDDDVYFRADDLIAELRRLEASQKGRLFSASLSDEGAGPSGALQRTGTFIDGAITTPMIFARDREGLQFKRPFTVEDAGLPQRSYYFVYQDHWRAAPGEPEQEFPEQIIAELRQAAATMMLMVPDDCLSLSPNGPSVFNVISQSEWNSLSAMTRAYQVRIRVVYGPKWDGVSVPQPSCHDGQGVTCETTFSCDADGTAQACAVFPRSSRKLTLTAQGVVSGATVRVIMGTHLGIVSTPDESVFALGPTGLDNPYVTPAERVRLLMHEMGHLMGLAHADTRDTFSIVVPGTSAAPLQSIMYSGVHAGTPGPSDGPSADDLLTIKTLYGHSRPRGCEYEDQFYDIEPLTCPPGSVQNGDVCCSASCGVCGEEDCGTRPGGEASCCAGAIRDSGVYCSGQPPCILR